MSPPLERRPSALRAPHAPLVLALLGASACQPPPAQGPEALRADATAQHAASALDGWLAQHPAVASAIVWETERGAVPWTRWDGALRRDLEEAFVAATASLQGRGDSLGFPLHDPPPNLAAERSHTQTVLSPGDAWRLYVAHVGHSLALEVARIVPWSLAGDPPEALQALLDGRSMFAWKRELGGYLLDAGRAGWVVPAPPAVELGFLTREHLLGPTRLATIEAMVGWARQLHHVNGKLDLENGERVWQYRGMAPVSRVLAGTGPGSKHVTAGCWGTTGLFIAVLRAANIPVRLVNVRGPGGGCSHAQPYFVSEGRYLSHGDDPYNRIILSLADTIPASRLFVDQATWTGWYGEAIDLPARCSNVGRQVREIALETAPAYLVDLYCDDERRGLDHGSGRVARAFLSGAPGTAFPMSRLTQARLWERLADRARSTGACSRSPVGPQPAERDPAEPTGEP